MPSGWLHDSNEHTPLHSLALPHLHNLHKICPVAVPSASAIACLLSAGKGGLHNIPARPSPVWLDVVLHDIFWPGLLGWVGLGWVAQH
jgi:hypothetical protein